MDLYEKKNWPQAGTLSHAESCLQAVVKPFLSLYWEFKKSFESQFPSTFSAESDLIEETLNHFYEMGAKIVIPSEVRNYLYRYPDIAKLARFVSDEVYQSFDCNIQLSLNIVNEDDDPGNEYLALYLRTQSYDDAVMDKIVKIQESYYDSLSQITGWFLFTTDFSLPR